MFEIKSTRTSIYRLGTYRLTQGNCCVEMIKSSDIIKQRAFLKSINNECREHDFGWLMGVDGGRCGGVEGFTITSIYLLGVSNFIETIGIPTKLYH